MLGGADSAPTSDVGEAAVQMQNEFLWCGSTCCTGQHQWLETKTFSFLLLPPTSKAGFGSAESSNLQKTLGTCNQVRCAHWVRVQPGISLGMWSSREWVLFPPSNGRSHQAGLWQPPLECPVVFPCAPGCCGVNSERLQVFHSHSWHTLLPWALDKRESKSQILLCPGVHLPSFQLVYAWNPSSVFLGNMRGKNSGYDPSL